MDITYVHQYFASRGSFSGTRSLEFARRWQSDHGHSVTVLTTTAALAEAEDQRQRTASYVIDGVRVHALRSQYSNQAGTARRFWEWIRFAIWSSMRLLHMRVQGTVDIVYATSTPLTVAVPAIIARILLRLPYVFEVRDVWPDAAVAVGAMRDGSAAHRIARALERSAYRLASTVIPLSPDMHGRIATRVRPGSLAAPIPNGADFRLVEPREKESARRLALQDFGLSEADVSGRTLGVYAGTIGLVNAPDYWVQLIRASRDLELPLMLLVYGTGREAAALSQSCLGSDLGRSLLVHDPIPKKEMLRRLPGFDFGLSTVLNRVELWGNSANKVYEYLGVGVPPVVNHGGWLAEALRGSSAGLVLPSVLDGSPDELRRCLNTLHDDAKRRELAANCLGLAADFDWDVLAQRAETVVSGLRQPA